MYFVDHTTPRLSQVSKIEVLPQTAAAENTALSILQSRLEDFQFRRSRNSSFLSQLQLPVAKTESQRNKIGRWNFPLLLHLEILFWVWHIENTGVLIALSLVLKVKTLRYEG